MSTSNVPRGPGLFEVAQANGDRVITNIRRIAGADRSPGSALIGSAAWLLAALGAGLLFVSFAGQFTYIFLARHQDVASVIEALMFDVGMIIFTLLALGLARAGKPARTERTLIMACSFGSAAMNYGAADTASPRSVVAYVAAPVFLAVVVDRVVAVVRRHVLGEDEGSAWSALGRAVLTAMRLAAITLVYSLRFVLAPSSTATGLRRWLLAVTPLPVADKPIGQQGDEDKEPPELEGASKRARLAWWYERDPAYGDRATAAAAAKRLAPLVGLGEGTARAYIGQILTDLEKAGEAS